MGIVVGARVLLLLCFESKRWLDITTCQDREAWPKQSTQKSTSSGSVSLDKVACLIYNPVKRGKRGCGRRLCRRGRRARPPLPGTSVVRYFLGKTRALALRLASLDSPNEAVPSQPVPLDLPYLDHGSNTVSTAAVCTNETVENLCADKVQDRSTTKRDSSKRIPGIYLARVSQRSKTLPSRPNQTKQGGRGGRQTDSR